MYSHIDTRVCAISEAATAVQEEEFRGQKAVLESRRYMLVTVLASWRALRDDLDAKGEVQSAAQQRRSLMKMISKLEAVKTRVEATVAAYKVANGGLELPVRNMEAVVEEFAAQYSSVAAVESAYGLQLGAAYGLEAGERTAGEEQQAEGGERPRECRFYKSGTCWRGKKCKYLHNGKPASVTHDMPRPRQRPGEACIDMVRQSEGRVSESRGAAGSSTSLDPAVAHQCDL